ncbi:MAG TPA: hypothetical protein VFM14_07525 [Gemmatimonadales bacterium]|nr:hypothetical protein [Gemmatimonadales bacterium]
MRPVLEPCPAYAARAAKWLPIPWALMDEAVARPDAVESGQMVGREPRQIGFSLKALAGRPGQLLVLTTRDRTSAVTLVVDAWTIPEWMIERELTPMSALDAVCCECGLWFRVGSRVAQLIRSEILPGLAAATNDLDTTPKRVERLVQLMDRPATASSISVRGCGPCRMTRSR